MVAPSHNETWKHQVTEAPKNQARKGIENEVLL
jgi:hypothetical protein